MNRKNLRNGPVDKRRLKESDQYQSRSAARKLAQARLNRGELAWSGKVNIGRQEQTPGTGGFGLRGIAIQQQRVREQGQELRRSKALRPQ